MNYSHSKRQLHNYTSTPNNKAYSNQSIPSSIQSDEAADAIKVVLSELNDLKAEMPQSAKDRLPRITQLLQVYYYLFYFIFYLITILMIILIIIIGG